MVTIVVRQRTLMIAAAIVALIIIAAGAYFMAMKPKQVLLETTEGNITIELAGDMPVTAGNFESLVKKGFYDGTVFHRVIKDFMTL